MSKPILFVGALILALLAPLQGAIILSSGFENPPYTVGALAGQDGWIAFGTTAMTVENTTVESGAQAVQVSGSTTAQSGPFHAILSTGPLIDVNVDLRLASSTSQTSWQFAANGPGLVGFLGGIDVDSASNSILAITSGFPIIGTFTRDSWHDLDLLFDMTAQRYSIRLDGALLASNLTFCGTGNIGPCNDGVLGTLGPVIFDTFGGANGNDSGFMDNLSVQTVPEPSTIALLGTGLLFIVRRRSR